MATQLRFLTSNFLLSSDKNMSSSRSRHQEVTEFTVRPDVEEWAALTDELTVPDDDSILREIDNYPEGGDLKGEGNGDSEETIMEPPRQRFNGKLHDCHRQS